MNIYLERRHIAFIVTDEDDWIVFKQAVAEICPNCFLSEIRKSEQLFSMHLEKPVDFIFIDLEEPDKNLKDIRAVKADSKLKVLPLVVYSSIIWEQDVRTAYESGADLFFIKPSGYAALQNALYSILSLDWSQPALVKNNYMKNGHYSSFQLAAAAS